jgi:Lrp/AsnC family transcriptional regulator for asnA, asnC and gidA
MLYSNVYTFKCRPYVLVRKLDKARMDELDRKIISLLERNGRASNARIARDVGVSEGTVRRRLKRLINEQIINVIALPDPRKLGYNSEALIGVQVDPDKVDEVASKMANLEHTRWVTVTTGSYDVFAWATLPNAESLGRFLRDAVGAIDGVRRTETFVNLQVMKREFGIPA